MIRLKLKACAMGLALATALLAFAPTGFAQDANFKGFYIGGNVGGAFGTSNATTSTVYDPSPAGYFPSSPVDDVNNNGLQHLSPSGVSGGGQAGYNIQSGHFVLGAVVDFGAMNLSDSKSITVPYTGYVGISFTIAQSVKTSWLFTARPRAGYAAGRVLVYGTAGLAVTNLNYQAVFTDDQGPATENGGVKSSRSGWTAGGGLEYRLKKRWSLQGEYLYAGFGKVSTLSTNLMAYSPAIAYPSNPFTHSATLHANIARFGVNFRF